MEIDRKELKRQARERMVLTDPKFWVVALAYIVMTTGVSWLFSFLPIPHTRTTLLFFQLLLTLYTTVVQFGLCLWALWGVFAPRDLRIPISLVRSVTDTSIIFITPIPPTIREMAATQEINAVTIPRTPFNSAIIS